jgi:hypothetical protein
MDERNFLNSGNQIREMRMMHRILEGVRHIALPALVKDKMEELTRSIQDEVTDQWNYYIVGLVRELAGGDHPRQIRELLASNGGKISTIRYIRETLNIDLIAAKAVMDQLDKGEHNGYSL